MFIRLHSASGIPPIPSTVFRRARRLGGVVSLAALLLVLPCRVSKAQAPSLDDDPNYRDFTGLSETSILSAAEAEAWRRRYSEDVASTILGYRGLKFDLPLYQGTPIPKPAGLIAGEPFEQLMIHAVDPASQGDNPYAAVTQPYEQRLEAAILAHPGRVTPGDVIRLALDATDGNCLLAVLTAHNVFKNITYQGRNQAKILAGVVKLNPNKRFSARFGGFANKLVSLRETPQTGVGRTDKMGIWYHSFVILSVGVWVGPEAASAAITEEYGVRRLGSLTNMGSPVDPEKQSSDEAFLWAARQIRDTRALPGVVSNVTSLDKYTVLSGTGTWTQSQYSSGLALKIDVGAGSFSGVFGDDHTKEAALPIRYSGTMEGTYTGNGSAGSISGTFHITATMNVPEQGEVKADHTGRVEGTLAQGVAKGKMIFGKEGATFDVPVRPR